MDSYVSQPFDKCFTSQWCIDRVRIDKEKD